MAPYRRLNNAVPGDDVPWTLAEGTEKKLLSQTLLLELGPLILFSAGTYGISFPCFLAIGLTELTPRALLGFLLPQQLKGCLSSPAESAPYDTGISLHVCIYS